MNLILSLLPGAFMGAIIGAFIAWVIIRYKMAKEAKNVIQNIKNQSKQEFMIPKISGKGDEEQEKINLSNYCGISAEPSSQ